MYYSSHVHPLPEWALLDLLYVIPKLDDTYVIVLVLTSSNHEFVGSFSISMSYWKEITNAPK